MGLWMMAVGLAAPLDEEAQAKVTAFGPHVATYVKEGTTDPYLVLDVRGPQEATARVHSADGLFMISVDPTHMRIRLDDTTCAVVDGKRIIEEARALAMGHSQPVGPPSPRLIYRVTPDEQIDLSTAFLGLPSPVLFSWHADLVADGVTTTTEKDVWHAVSGTSSWDVQRKTGLLARMAVSDDALVLHEVIKGKKATPSPAAEICPKTTAPDLQQPLATQMRMFAMAEPTGALVKAWPSLDSSQKKAAQELHTQWWRGFFADELPAWERGHQAADWPALVLSGVTDVAAFETFKASLPLEQQADAVMAWKSDWFDRVAQDLLRNHIIELRTSVASAVFTRGGDLSDESVANEVLLQPMQMALLAEAEGAVQRLIVPVVEEGGLALQAKLTP